MRQTGRRSATGCNGPRDGRIPSSESSREKWFPTDRGDRPNAVRYAHVMVAGARRFRGAFRQHHVLRRPVPVRPTRTHEKNDRAADRGRNPACRHDFRHAWTPRTSGCSFGRPDTGELPKRQAGASEKRCRSRERRGNSLQPHDHHGFRAAHRVLQGQPLRTRVRRALGASAARLDGSGRISVPGLPDSFRTLDHLSRGRLRHVSGTGGAFAAVQCERGAASNRRRQFFGE